MFIAQTADHGRLADRKRNTSYESLVVLICGRQYVGLSTSAFRKMVLIPFDFNGIMTTFRKTEVGGPLYLPFVLLSCTFLLTTFSQYVLCVTTRDQKQHLLFLNEVVFDRSSKTPLLRQFRYARLKKASKTQ